MHTDETFLVVNEMKIVPLIRYSIPKSSDLEGREELPRSIYFFNDQ